MKRKIDQVDPNRAASGEFDEIVDVRSPSEFEEDHLAGAINLPVLDDEERARVGTIYKRESAFEARKIGAALVSRNIAHHLEVHFAEKPRDYRPVLYCWRGGQRSGSLATVLADVGWHVGLLEGGYRSYRRAVVEFFESASDRLRLVVLNGYTGAGKTLVLASLEEAGEQVLDLEGFARHKGSVFGGDLEAPQPAQKRFESLLHDRLSRFDLDRPVFIEAESAKIGRLNLPNPLWQRMKESPVIEVDSPLEARAAYLTEDYREWLGDVDRIAGTLDRLKGFHPAETITRWKELARDGEWYRFTEELLRDHYDRRYTVKGDGNYPVPSHTVSLPHHDHESVVRCAGEVAEAGRMLREG